MHPILGGEIEQFAPPKLGCTHLHPEVVQRLLAQMCFIRIDVEGVLPGSIELQVIQRRFVGQVEHFLEDQYAEGGRHRLVGPPVVLAEQRPERLLVDQKNRQGFAAKASGPVVLLQPGNLLRRKQTLSEPNVAC